MTDSAVRLECTSDPGQCAAVRSMVRTTGGHAGFDERTLNRIVLAIDEALTNIIRHGYGGRGGEPIVLEIRTLAHDRPGLQFVLQDRGRQVEPEEIVGRRLDDVRPGGLGTHIIRSIMDVVEYSKRRGGGMQLRLVKYLARPDTPEAPPEGDTHAC